MGKKCVQPSNKARITLCISDTYPQNILSFLVHVGKSSVQSKALLSQIHRQFTSFYQVIAAGLYTVSTVPTITTICLKNKRQLITAGAK
jgi:hypothetical protein